MPGVMGAREFGCLAACPAGRPFCRCRTFRSLDIARGPRSWWRSRKAHTSIYLLARLASTGEPGVLHFLSHGHSPVLVPGLP